MKTRFFGRFRAGQLAPFLFLVLHYIVLNTAARLRLTFFLKTADPEAILYDRLDPAAMREAALAADVQNYASFYMALILIPVYILYLWQRRKSDPGVVKLRRLSAPDWFASLSVIVGALGAVTIWMTLLVFLSERSEWLARLLADYTDLSATFAPATASLWFTVLNIVFLVPIAEELLFRGIIQGEFSLVLPRRWAIALTLILFSLFHLNPIQVSYVILPAFVLSYVYALTESFFVPIAMHMIFNLLGSGLLAALTGISLEWQVVVQWLFIGIGIVSLWHLKRRDAARSSVDAAEETVHADSDYQ